MLPQASFPPPSLLLLKNLAAPGGSDKGEVVAGAGWWTGDATLAGARLTVMNEPSGLLIIRHSQAERGPLIKTSVAAPHSLIPTSSLPPPPIFSSSALN